MVKHFTDPTGLLESKLYTTQFTRKEFSLLNKLLRTEDKDKYTSTLENTPWKDTTLLNALQSANEENPKFKEITSLILDRFKEIKIMLHDILPYRTMDANPEVYITPQELNEIKLLNHYSKHTKTHPMFAINPHHQPTLYAYICNVPIEISEAASLYLSYISGGTIY
jgi:mevalonate pyrophosphate decarboxylase